MRYEGRVDLIDVEREMARLDAVYRPVATTAVDVTDVDAFTNMGAGIQADLARLAVDDQAEAVLRAVIEMYVAGDEAVRAAVRSASTGTPRSGGRSICLEGGTPQRSFVPVSSTFPPAIKVRTRATRS